MVLKLGFTVSPSISGSLKERHNLVIFLKKNCLFIWFLEEQQLWGVEFCDAKSLPKLKVQLRKKCVYFKIFELCQKQTTKWREINWVEFWQLSRGHSVFFQLTFKRYQTFSPSLNQKDYDWNEEHFLGLAESLTKVGSSLKPNHHPALSVCRYTQ